MQLDHFSDEKKTKLGKKNLFFFSHTHTQLLFLPLEKKFLSTAPTTCRDGWLGFLFRWRTQQSAISGINCRIIQLPNLWTQKAHGRSSLRVIPVHAASQCRTKNLSFPLLRCSGSCRESLTMNERARRWMKYPKIRAGWCVFFRWCLSRGGSVKKQTNTQTNKNNVFVPVCARSSFTDLSAAGLPAELKHITQRRKRKQPWFPQSAASEEGPNSLPNRVLKALSCGNNAALWMVREWRNSSAKQTHCWIQPFMWVLSQRRC